MNWRRHYRYTFIAFFWTLSLAAQPTQLRSGRVLNYLTNRVGDYDGLRLSTKTGELRLHFPPHIAVKVFQVAPVGQFVVATLIAPPNRMGDIPPPIPAFRLLSLQNQRTKTGFQISDFPPPSPTQGKLVEAEATLVGELEDDAGRLTALVTDRYIIDLKPHQSESVRALLTGVTRLGVVGYERTEPGFINKTGRKLIHPAALTINGQTFAL